MLLGSKERDSVFLDAKCLIAISIGKKTANKF